jgi:hypothetical protein
MSWNPRIMPSSFANQELKPGYEGALEATRHPALANRFHFWRGPSGRRYACTLFGVDTAPAYDQAIALFVRRGRFEPRVIAVSAGVDGNMAPPETDEIHIHLVQGGPDALVFALRDLAGLVAVTQPLECFQRRAA